MPRVLVTTPMIRNIPGAYSRLLESHGLEVAYPPQDADTMQPDVLRENLQGIDAMLASTDPLTRDILAGSTLRVVARMGVGYDSVDVEAATDLGILVTITPGAVEESVAEHTIGLMFAVSRNLVGRDAEVRRGEWARDAGPRMKGKTFGIIGLGRIGKTVAGKMQALGMQVRAYDPVADEKYAQANNIELCSLDDLLAGSDVVSLHAPCIPSTEKIINAQTLAKMKADAILINTGRGGLVDEAALYAAMHGGHLKGAALDVFQQEPTPLDNPLLTLKNLVACTHMGGLDRQSQSDMGEIAARCVAELHAGRWPEGCVVNDSLRAGWSW